MLSELLIINFKKVRDLASLFEIRQFVLNKTITGPVTRW
jgi:hypothetical protein